MMMHANRDDACIVCGKVINDKEGILNPYAFGIFCSSECCSEYVYNSYKHDRIDKNISTVHVDNINHPKHYCQGSMEAIDAIEGLGLSYHEGNVLKYLCRHRLKGGKESLLKAIWYINRIIETEYDTISDPDGVLRQWDDSVERGDTVEIRKLPTDSMYDV